MADVRDTLPPAQLEGLIGHYATVSKAPVDFTDRIAIIIPDFDPSLEWGPCRWQSRDPVSLPAVGDECFVMFDNRREPWIVAWWPAVFA